MKFGENTQLVEEVMEFIGNNKMFNSHTGGRAIWGGGEAGRKGEIKKRILEMISWD